MPVTLLRESDLLPVHESCRDRLRHMLSPGLLRHGQVEVELINVWNQRCLASLDESLHAYWEQCVSATNIIVVS